MNLVRFVLFGWMFYLINAFGSDESISFSPIKLENKATSVSYWYHNISLSRETSLLREGINIQLYLNQRQGLLFYTIDSKYRTLWVEFTNDFLEIYYYNFRISNIDMRHYGFDKLCSQKPDSNIDLTFSLRNSEIVVRCNGNSQKVDYIEPPDPINQEDFIAITNTMVLPIPDFSNVSDTQNNVHIWIGNTPSVNDQEFKNILKLKSYPLNLHGCVKLITIKSFVLNLASSGLHYGELLTSKCRPVCTPTLCQNDGQCKETWRGRFKCECESSQYVGKFCNESYSLKFDSLMAVEMETYFKLQTITLSFQPIIYSENPGLKLLSLKFYGNHFLHVLITKDNLPAARFLTEDESRSLLATSETKILNGNNYTLSIDVHIDVINIKVNWIRKFDTLHSDQISIKTPYNNLIVTHILIGDSHAKTMEQLNKFHGCISNFFWQSGTRRFLWNEMSNFSMYSKCGETKILTTTILTKKLGKNYKNTESLTTYMERGKVNSEKNTEINYSHMTYIAIAIATLIIGFLISIIIIYKCREKHIKKEDVFVNSDKEKLQMSQMYTPVDSIDTPYTVTLPIHPYPETTFKPAYKARSMSSSTNGRSMLSLPLSVTPSLATPEGEIL